MFFSSYIGEGSSRNIIFVPNLNAASRLSLIPRHTTSSPFPAPSSLLSSIMHGVAEIKTIPFTFSGYLSHIRSALDPPIEKPTRTTSSESSITFSGIPSSCST